MDRRWDAILAVLRESDVDPDYLGSTVLVLRRLRGLSDEELAEKAGITAAELARIEEGKLYPAEHELCSILDALGVDVVRLLFAMEEVRLLDELLIRSKSIPAALPNLALGEGLSLPRDTANEEDEEEPS